MGYLSAEKKQELFGQYGKSNTDTGSPYYEITPERGAKVH